MSHAVHMPAASGAVGMRIAILGGMWDTADVGLAAPRRGRGAMTRRQKDPLRPLTEAERAALEQLSGAQSEPASHVARARLVLAVAAGQSYTAAARSVG